MKKLLLVTLLFLNLFSQDNIILNETIPLEKTKNYYEKKENLLIETPKVKENKDKKKDGLEFDGNVGVDKQTKSIDSVNINIGSKF